MAVMSNGMSIMGISQPTQSVVRGVVLLIAVAFDVWNKKRSQAGA
jgi:putative multiple sugar transport system permease protein